MHSALQFNSVNVQHITANWLAQDTALDVLRLDRLHPVVSGNKWFKLKYYLSEAQQQGYNTIATYGGAYSNHIVAAAFACRACGLNSVGIIRGEEPKVLSPTLVAAIGYGMQLQFVSRQQFSDKENIKPQYSNVYRVNEGGYGANGAKGAGEILALVPRLQAYTHIICAVGTGTMLAGLINSALPGQRVLGISVLKNNFSIKDEVDALVNKHAAAAYEILHGYDFGGYAKHPPELIHFMQETWQESALPTDIVYTAKTFYAVKHLIKNNTITAGSRVLMVHSGGLQGNTSLQKGVLPF